MQHHAGLGGEDHRQSEPSGRVTSAGARLTVDRLKLMGFSSEPVVDSALDTREGGKAMLAELTKAETGAAEGPFRAFVAYVQGCRSVAEVVARRPQLRGR